MNNLPARVLLDQKNVLRFIYGLFVASLVILMLGIYNATDKGIKIETDLTKLFPQDPAHPLINHVNAGLFAAFGNNFVVAVAATDKKTVLAASDIVDTALKHSSVSDLFIPAEIDEQLELQQQQQQLLSAHRYHLLTSDQTTSLTGDDQRRLMSDAQRAIFGFGSSGLSPFEDPLNLIAQNLQVLQLPIAGEIHGEKILIEADGKFAVLRVLKLSTGAFEINTQDRVNAWLLTLKQQLDEHSDFSISKNENAAENNALDKNQHTLTKQSVELLLSGAVFHAADAASHARKEMTVIGAGSLIGIIILFGIAFRQLSPLVLTLLSVGFGCAFAFFTTLAIFGNVHLITLVFGASLIGVAVDYSLHYLCKQQAESLKEVLSSTPPKSVRDFLLPALTLSLLTSVLGYSCLLQTPLTGLRQIACFSVLGLIAAWLFVIALYPHISPRHYREGSPLVDKAAKFFWDILFKISKPLGWVLAIAATVIVLYGFLNVSLSRDVRTLYKPSVELMHSEKTLQSMLNGVSPNQYFLLTADTPELLLQHEENFIKESLAPLKNNKAISGWTATSDWVPSIAQQQKNYRIQKNTIYNESGLLTNFFASIGFLSDAVEQSRVLFNAAENNYFLPEQWITRARPDQALLWQGEFENQYVSIVGLRGIKDIAQLRDLETSHILFVDRVGDLSVLLGNLIRAAGAMLAAAYLVVACLLVVVYRRRSALLIVSVPLLSTLLSLSLLTLMGQDINLFHVFGCYLILGLGIDYAIFSYINGDNDAVARRAIWLAAMTSSLSFGLLALSQTPMVQSFGMVLALGCLWNLLLAPLVSGKLLKPRRGASV